MREKSLTASLARIPNAESARMSRNNYGWNRESFCQFAGVQASCSTKGDEGEVAGIVSTLDRNHAQRSLHVGIHDLQYTGGELLQGKTRLLFL